VPQALVPSVVLAAFTADSSSLITVDARPSTSGMNEGQLAGGFGRKGYKLRRKWHGWTKCWTWAGCCALRQDLGF
jgi:hypothetical protein